MNRRQFLGSVAASVVASNHHGPSRVHAARTSSPVRRPVIDVTDLYHPHQDRGDNFDLIAAYALPQIDLRAVVFDVTERFRRPFRNPEGTGYDDPTGPREAGFVPVEQLNHIFNKSVPCACAPFEPMRDPADAMEDAPAPQQAGIDLLLQAIMESESPVDIVSFGSARPVAVAYNRMPHLMRRKVRRVHVCAGAAPRGYLEWNVFLDVHAFVRLLRSDLPIAIYPCATNTSPFEVGRHNCYWSIPDINFVRTMAPPLQRYVEYAFTRSNRHDFLTMLRESDPVADMTEHYDHPHHIWETAVWMDAAELRLVRRGVEAAIVAAHEMEENDVEVPQTLRPVRVEVDDDGQFDFTFTEGPSNTLLYDRGDAAAQQDALRLAFPGWFGGFSPV